MSLAAAVVFGLGLGMKHAFEADHVAAVCTFIARGGSVASAAQAGALWGLGHAAVIVLGGGALVATGAQVPGPVALVLDIAVALMLIGMGIAAVARRRRAAARMEHAPARPGRRPIAVGLVHGASGTAALTMLVATTIPVRAQALLFVGTFGAASVLAMALIAALVAWSMRSLTRRAPTLGPRLEAVAGLGSIAAGIAVACSTLGGAAGS
jgi:hypothetical protein